MACSILWLPSSHWRFFISVTELSVMGCVSTSTPIHSHGMWVEELLLLVILLFVQAQASKRHTVRIVDSLIHSMCCRCHCHMLICKHSPTLVLRHYLVTFLTDSMSNFCHVVDEMTCLPYMNVVETVTDAKPKPWWKYFRRICWHLADHVQPQWRCMVVWYDLDNKLTIRLTRRRLIACLD